MIDIEIIDSDLILKYFSEREFAPDWVDPALKNEGYIIISRIFKVQKQHLIKTNTDDPDVPEYYFKIGELLNDYFKIDTKVLNLKNNFYLHNSLDIGIKCFVVETKISLLGQIDRLVDQDVFIGGQKEDILPASEFEKLIKAFPNSHEIKLYRQAKVTSILKDYFTNIVDGEQRFHSYLNKKVPFYNSQIRKMFKDAEILKYETLHGKLFQMLEDEVNYTEKQWQQEILQIILLIFPKYISAFSEVEFDDIYNNKKRRLDFGLIDYMGNLDIVEIKIPFENSIVSVSQYRDNHIPNKSLSGTIMQIEKYIFYLNKLGKTGEDKLTKKFKDHLPKDLVIKIINPNGIIIMGRDKELTKEQISDFEIIKRKYKNVIDIFTYDDLLRRLKMIINQLEKL